MTEQQVIDFMKDAGAYQEGHFQMKSGKHANAYLQCAHLIEHADITDKICQALSEKCRECDCDLIISPAIGGMIFGCSVARILEKRFIFCERKDGVMTLRRNFSIAPGAKVLIVEDMVTTGGSVREVMEIVRAFGAETVMIAAIVDRTRGKVNFGVPYSALAKVNLVKYSQDECPMCRASVPFSHPGKEN